MPIIRSSDQLGQTLEEFYRDLSATGTNSYADVGTRMISVLDIINDIFPDRIIYGLTSVSRLVLLAEDNGQSDWLIIISSGGSKEYQFEYLMPKAKAPWPQATVKGMAQSLEEVKDYLLISMRACKGWPYSIFE